MIQVSARRLTLLWIDLMVLAFALAHICLLLASFPEPGISTFQLEMHGLHDETMLLKFCWMGGMGLLGLYAGNFAAFALVSYRHAVKPLGRYAVWLWILVCFAPGGVFWVYHFGGRRSLRQGLLAHQ